MTKDILRQRPHTSLGYHSNPAQYVDTDTKLAGDFVLTPGFRQTLENFFPKASPEDKARCLELLTALDIGDNLREQAKDVPEDITGYQPPACVEVSNSQRKRPKSAMAYHNTSRVDIMNPYTTSYKVDYQEKDLLPDHADRPRSTRNYHASYDLSGPIGVTSYQSEYYKKGKAKPTYTAYEPRRNNPHPLESFMVWKLGRNPGIDPTNKELRRQLTDDMMDKVCRGQLNSTYQQDYLGIPQGSTGIKEAFAPDQDISVKMPYTLDSIMRHSYQKPTQQCELRGNNTRYGCNRSKHIPAHGVVPTVSKRHNFMNLKTRTTYEREFNDQVHPKAADVRDLAKQYGTLSLQRHYARAPTPERPMIKTMIKTMSDGVTCNNNSNIYHEPVDNQFQPYEVHAPRTPSRAPSSQYSTRRSTGGKIKFAVPPATYPDHGAEDNFGLNAWDSPQISQQAY